MLVANKDGKFDCKVAHCARRGANGFDSPQGVMMHRMRAHQNRGGNPSGKSAIAKTEHRGSPIPAKPRSYKTSPLAPIGSNIAIAMAKLLLMPELAALSPQEQSVIFGAVVSARQAMHV